jgi:hypothetical protein
MVTVEDFPFRLDEHTLSLVSDIISALARHNSRLQSQTRGGSASVLFDKEKVKGVQDVNVTFDPEGMLLQYPLQAIRRDEQIRAWMNTFHAQLQKQKGSPLTPDKGRCFVTVKAFYNGQIHYYLTYMVAYPDNSLAQDTPQGALYASAGLPGIARAPQAKAEAGDASDASVW